MSDSILNQDEIDALAAGVLPEKKDPLSPDSEAVITYLEKTVKQQIETVLSAALSLNMELTGGSHASFDLQTAVQNLDEDLILVTSAFTQGASGKLLFLVNRSDAAMIADLMMMGEGSTEFLPEHIDAMREVFNQITGSLSTRLNGLQKSVFSFAQAEVEEIDQNNLISVLEGFASTVFIFKVADKIDSHLMMLIDPACVKAWKALLAPAGKSPPAASRSSAPQAQSSAVREEKVRINQPDLPSFEKPASSHAGHGLPTNIDMLLDIALPIAIELGRTNMLIRDILELGHGSIVELNKLAGEPVDILVNDKVIARGEVVVIDENFGVRITSLVGMEERIKSLR